MDAFSSRHRSVVLAMLEREQAPVVDAPQAGAAGATFEDIYRDHYRDVHRYVLLSLRRPDDVEDVVADTFDRAFAAWRSGHGPAGRPLPWLLLIARRIVVDRWRRNRLLRWLPLAIGTARSEPSDPSRDSERTEFWIWLDRLAEILPERQRDVVYLRYQRDLSDDDIGEILGLSASGVRTLAARALTALRQHPELWS